jgi:hypothetical protein
MTRPLKTCLDCGARHNEPGPRCRPHHLAHQRTRNASRPQYAGAWRTTSRRARQAEPWCHRPGCPNPFTRDLTFDHETETVECRSCNSSHRRNPA